MFDEGGYTGAIGRKKIAGVVHGQEFVINAEATAQHRSLLEAINDGRFPGYEDGGYVGPPMASHRGGSGSSGGGGVEVHVHPAAGVETVEKKTRAANGGERIDFYQQMKSAAVEAAGDGDMDGAMQGRFDTRRKIARR